MVLDDDGDDFDNLLKKPLGKALPAKGGLNININAAKAVPRLGKKESARITDN